MFDYTVTKQTEFTIRRTLYSLFRSPSKCVDSLAKIKPTPRISKVSI